MAPTLIYLDSNVFIHATLNPEDPGLRARRLLTRVEDGEIEASTSTLTV